MTIVKQKINDYVSINTNQTHPDWDASATYAFGDVVFYGHYYYKSVIDANVGKNPESNTAEWLLWSISNRYAQIDQRASTSTIWDASTATTPADNRLITVIKTDNINKLTLGRVYGGDINVTIRDSSGTVVNTITKTAYPRKNSNNWYGYFFDEFITSSVHESFIFNIPSLIGGTITIEVDKGDDGSAKVGLMVGGRGVYVGDSLFGVTTPIEDNSIWQTDDFGITSVYERDASEMLDIDVQYPSIRTNEIKLSVRDVVGEIVLFIGDERSDSNYDHFLILGKIDSFTPIISNPIMTKASFSIKEII